MADSTFFESLKQYDYVQYVIPDINTIPRGKIFCGEYKEKVATRGFEIANILGQTVDLYCNTGHMFPMHTSLPQDAAACSQFGTSGFFTTVCLSGPNAEFPLSANEILGKHFPNEELQPCLDTLTPWPWVGGENRRVGSVLCDLMMFDGTPDLTSPRQLLRALLDTLKSKHGLLLKSAFEYEFGLYKADTLEPLGGDRSWCWDVRHWGEHHDLFCDLTDYLKLMGVNVSSLMPEANHSQWEITTEPLEGVRAGDVAFYVKNAVKGFFKTRGYNATFMSKPFITAENMGTGLHLNHSLWTSENGEEQNVLLSRTDVDHLSATARHWLAGILTHAPAITALCCPTLNCYRRLFHLGSPENINWGEDNRTCLIRVHTARDNIFFENRLPSGPCNPYLAMAATVAAGIDGLDRQLACPKAQEVDQTKQLPKTLAQALDVLEKDDRLCSLLGDRFVGCYVRAKREYEIERFEKAGLNTEEKQLEYERHMYMDSL